jgi:hypothetical protein
LLNSADYTVSGTSLVYLGASPIFNIGDQVVFKFIKV